MFFLKKDFKKILSLSIVIKIILFFIIIYSIFNKDFSTVIMSSITLTVTFLPYKKFQGEVLRFPVEFELMMVFFLICTLVLGEGAHFYEKFWWWDIFLHSFSGIIFSFIGFLIIYSLYIKEKIKSPVIVIALFSFSISLAIGALWEIFEFTMDSFFSQWSLQKMQPSLLDTMQDLIADAVGAVFISFIGYIYVKTEKKGIGVFDYFVKKFTKK